MINQKRRQYTAEFKREAVELVTKQGYTVAERFFRTLKTESLLNWRNMSAEEVKYDIVDYVEIFYNSERLHSYDGYLSPNDYEKIRDTLV